MKILGEVVAIAITAYSIWMLVEYVLLDDDTIDAVRFLITGKEKLLDGRTEDVCQDDCLE